MTRWFNADTCTVDRHEPGDRHWRVGDQDMEWTGALWTLVCPRCDKPMRGRTNGALGYLCCTDCGLQFVEVPDRSEPPAGVTS